MRNKTIYWDLETTSLYYVGQIVNYCFVAVDENGKVVEECSGDIKLHPMQLPEPGAAIVTRIDYVNHQETASETEIEAMQKIHQFFMRHTPLYTERNKPNTMIIGHNSLKFDLQFLRTSMIRNGINPYINNKLQHHDFMEYCRTLWLLGDTNEIVPVEKPNFKLATVCGGDRWKDKLAQMAEKLCIEEKLGEAHHSRSDAYRVFLLAETLAASGYEHISQFPLFAPNYPNDTVCPGDVILRKEVNLKAKSKTSESRLMFVLRNRNYELWLDIGDYEKRGVIDIDSFKWFNRSTTAMFGLQVEYNTEKILPEALEAFDKLPGSKPEEKLFGSRNEDMSVDVEANIYRAGFEPIEALAQISQTLSRESKIELYKRLTNVDAKTLAARYAIREQTDIDKIASSKIYVDYVKSRYGDGTMRVDRGFGKPVHQTPLVQMIEQTKKYIDTGSPEEQQVAKRLLEFYKSSLPYQVLGLCETLSS